MSFSAELEQHLNIGPGVEAVCVCLCSVAADGSENSKASVRSQPQIEDDGSQLFILVKKALQRAALTHSPSNNGEKMSFKNHLGRSAAAI